MQDHWAEYGPPVYIAAAAWIGFQPKKKHKPRGDGDDRGGDDFVADMLAMYPDGGG